MEFNVDNQALVEKLPAAISSTEDVIANSERLCNTLEDIAKQVNVPALTKDIEVAITTVKSAVQSLECVLGQDGDRDIDGTAKGMLKTAKAQIDQFG